ncbi:DAHP synthetase [Lactarius vividus]|nr:DAHP synthetase [Lactarius vividus]
MPGIAQKASQPALKFDFQDQLSGRALRNNFCETWTHILVLPHLDLWSSGARFLVVCIGRIAGQYAKPRSSATEKIGHRDVMIFRQGTSQRFRPIYTNGQLTGETIFDPDERTPDPERLLSAYFHSTATLNHIRGLLTSSFALLHHPWDWSLLHVRSPSLRHEYEAISQGLSDALDFTRTIGLAAGRETQSYERGGGRGVLGEADPYTSHEGLLLDYEEAMTRLYPIPDSTISRELQVGTPEPKKYYWTARTSSIRNPIGIKVGPSMAADELVGLLDIVNPEHDNGRVTLITRYGVNKIATHLPIHIKAVQASGHPVIWVCDPMHGNTLTSSTGLKTRYFGTIISELTSCLRIHSECGSRPGGVSLEFTGELNEEGYSVTEILGESMELSEEQLGLRYQSFCDPRLNFEQSLDVAFLVSNYFNNQRRGDSRHKGNTDVLYSELGGNTASAGAA